MNTPWLTFHGNTVWFLLMKLQSLRSIVDSERPGLARYFSTGPGSFAVKDNGMLAFGHFISMIISSCD
jgi:hypothetical protein